MHNNCWGMFYRNRILSDKCFDWRPIRTYYTPVFEDEIIKIQNSFYTKKVFIHILRKNMNSEGT